MLRALFVNRWPEVAIVLAGCVLRMALGARYDVRLGFDFYDHARNIAWWMQRVQLPPIDWSRAAYHPPFYYVLAAALGRAGVGFFGLGVFSLALGCLRLGLLAWGLAIHLPNQRMARLVALALAAVLPASVHMDIMVTNEGLVATLATLALVLLPMAFADSARTRWRASIGLGVTLGLAVLTKVSALVIVAATAAAVGLALWRAPDREVQGSPGRVHRLAPPMVSLMVALLVSGWYFAHCKATYGKVFITGFDSWRSRGSLVAKDKPLLSRRPAGYLLGWSLAIYRSPFFPSAALDDARFLPQVLASTFADYYNYGLAPYPRQGAPAIQGPLRPLSAAVVEPAAVSVAGGTLIALLTAASFFTAVVLCWRRRAHGMLALVLVPAFALAGQAYFALSVANDAEGLVKGSYLQFAAAPLFALFGLAVAWSWRRRALRAVALLGFSALAAVAWYVAFCVFS